MDAHHVGLLDVQRCRRTGTESHLRKHAASAGDLVAQTLEHLDGGDPDVREPRVVHAGQEDGNARTASANRVSLWPS
jgi:hypothetical protein